MGKFAKGNIKSKWSAYKRDAYKAAKELRYPDSVLEKISTSNSDTEISRIMMTACQTYFA